LTFALCGDMLDFMLMPRTLANLVDKVARASVGKDWTLYAALLEHWEEIVGTEYARATTPVKLAFPHQPLQPRRCNGTLTVRLPKGLAMEFTFKAEQIKQRVNGYFGYEAVGRIVLESASIAPPKPKKATAPMNDADLAQLRRQTATVDNEDIKAALLSFGAAFINKKTL